MRFPFAPSRCALFAGSFVILLAACSSNSVTFITGAGAGTATGTGTSTGASTGKGSSTSTTSAAGGSASSGGACPGDLAKAPGSAFCQANPTMTDCGIVSPNDKNQVCGVPIPTPTKALTRSSNVMEFAGSGPPDLSCFQPAGYPKAGTSKKVTMSGVAKIFSHGCSSNGLSIEVHTVKPDGSVDASTLVGSAVSTDPSSCMTGVAVSSSDCGTLYECKYSYPNVPTETELVILTQGALWAPLYEYNDYIPDAEVMNGTWTHDVRALASDDYSLIPMAAIGSSVMTGYGVIAGEVHDGGNVRLTNATVGVNALNEGLTYFDSDEANPLPDLSAMSTSDLSLYAAFDLAPGPVSVGALGLVGGKVTTVGYFPAYVYPNAVTVVTFQGVRPFQVQ